jgi:hypothetical protein
MEWLWRLGVLSNERAVANARAATTELSRQRVVRDEVDLYLRDRYADHPARTAYVGLDAPAAEAAR